MVPVIFMAHLTGHRMWYITTIHFVFCSNPREINWGCATFEIYLHFFLFFCYPSPNRGTTSRRERGNDIQHRFKLMTLQRHCVHRADPVSRIMLFFHRVTDVEIKRGWAEWHPPATRSCAGRQTSVQWHPPHEYLVGAHAGDRGCHCSLWSQPSWVNLADREYKYIYTEILDIYLRVYSSEAAAASNCFIIITFWLVHENTVTLTHAVRRRPALITSTKIERTDKQTMTK